jgi:hypothetical protein
MHFYRAFGLRFQSALALPELASGEVTSAFACRDADVTIRFGKVEGLPAKDDDARRWIHATPEGIYLYWREIGTFLLRDGREIIIDPAAGVEERVLRLFTLGTTLALLLHQRGDVVVLHASAVTISGHTVAFVGAKHAGKSTIAATLHKRGHDLVADDILAIDLRENRALALPGFPHFKLWPDAVTSLGYVPESLPQLHPDLEKRGYRVSEGFLSTSTPLKCIYILCQGQEPNLEPLRPQEALMALMPHWYGARFGKELLQGLGLSTHFRQCADLVNRVTFCRLTRSPYLSALPDVAQLVEAHLDSVLHETALLPASLR